PSPRPRNCARAAWGDVTSFPGRAGPFLGTPRAEPSDVGRPWSEVRPRGGRRSRGRATSRVSRAAAACRTTEPIAAGKTLGGCQLRARVRDYPAAEGRETTMAANRALQQ